MKKIALSLATIGAVGTISTLALTGAWFTDTETSENNTFSTGTIDIAVDDQNPWTTSEKLTIEDLKPSQHEYTEFTIQNVGTNPANVWKELTFNGCNNEPLSEPEEEAENGTPVCDLQSVTNYDLAVKVYNKSDELIWNQTIFNEEVTMGEAYTEGRVFLGMIPAEWSMVVTQSYHMPEGVDNRYQGDSLSYTVTLTAEQLRGTVHMENKLADTPEDESWWIQHNDDIKGDLTYTVKDQTFDFTFTGKAPLPETTYYLINFKDPWGTPGHTFGSATSGVNGDLTITDSLDLGVNLTNAKIWLVTDADYNESTNKMSGWNPNNYLFETGLMDYYDSL